MSRFSPSRAGAIAVWTGAAVVWGTAAVAGQLQPTSAGHGPDVGGEVMVAAPTSADAPMPSMPAAGLIIIRPPRDPSVQRTTAVDQPSPSIPAPSEAVVPQPSSSGS